MKERLNILNLEDSPNDTELIQEKLNEEGIDCDILRIENREDFIAALERGNIDLVLADYTLPAFDGLSALLIVQVKFPDVPFIFVSGTIGENIAIEALKNGATDYVLKNKLSRLTPAIQRALKERDDRIERRRAEVALRESEDRYRALFMNSIDAVLLTVPDGSILSANPAACLLFGRTEEEIRVLGRDGLVDTADARLQELLEERARTGKASGELTFVRKDGSQFSGEVSSHVFKDKMGGLRTSMVIRDITERKRKEEELWKLNRTLLAKSKSSLAMMSARDEDWYLNEVCRIIVEVCGHALVWIGFAEHDDNRTVRPVAHAGFEEGYLETLKVTWADTERGRGPVGTAIRTGKPTVFRSTAADPRFAPWREEAFRRGYAAVVGIPLLADGKAFGSLNIYSRHNDPFSEDEVQLLNDLAADISYGISGIRLRTAQAEVEAALRQSEKRYRSLFENMLDGFAYCRMIFENDRPRDFIYLEVNSAFERLTGLKNVVERKVTDVIPGIRELHPELFEIYGRVALSGKPERFEFYLEPLKTWLSIAVYSTEKGTFVAAFDNITERKLVEEELRSSVRMWNNTFDAMNDAISIMDEKGTILRVNKTMLQLVDKLPQDIIGRSHWDIMHPMEGTVEDCPFSGMLKSHRRESTLFQRLSRWFTVIADPIIDQAGKLIGGVHVMTDITEHKQFEKQLQESESKFRVLAEQSLVGTYIIGDGIFSYVSPRFAEIFAYAAEELIGHKGPLDLVVAEDHRLVEENVRRRIAGEAAFSHYEVRGRKKTGEEVHLEVFGSAMQYHGRPTIIGMVLEVTERKKLEHQLRQAQKMEAIGQLTGGIAHDFNNILSAIIGYGSLLQLKMAEDDPQRPYVDQILASTDRAANLTRSLLTFSRKQITNLMPMDLNENIRRIEKLLRRIIGEDIDFRIALAPGDCIVNGDAGQIEQVLMNLATNARDAMPKGGMLSIETSIVEPGDVFGKPSSPGGSGSYVLISVTDTGVGMDEKTREKIFEPFFTTKDMGRGTGLGLSMVFGIIKQHNGHIHCYSEPGKGTTFKVYLPFLSAAEGKAELKTGMPAPAELSRGTETVLVAEDDETLRKLAKMTLEGFGYTVVEAVDGEDAIEKFRQNKDQVQLLLCDVIMPRLSGAEVCEAIRKISRHVKIVFMSGYPADFIHQKSLLDEGLEIVMKPIPPTVLLKKVREVLDKK